MNAAYLQVVAFSTSFLVASILGKDATAEDVQARLCLTIFILIIFWIVSAVLKKFFKGGKAWRYVKQREDLI